MKTFRRMTNKFEQCYLLTLYFEQHPTNSITDLTRKLRIFGSAPKGFRKKKHKCRVAQDFGSIIELSFVKQLLIDLIKTTIYLEVSSGLLELLSLPP